jgi:hypothetical protein
MITMPVP